VISSKLKEKREPSHLKVTRLMVKSSDVIIQEYQLHPVTGDILHVDLRVALPDLVTDLLRS